MARLVFNTAVFSLVRWPNLVIVALVQVLLYYRVLRPVFRQYHLEPSLDELRMVLLCLTTLCIAAAGYIINDIVDVQADELNRPAQRIVGRRIGISTAYWLYFMFNLVGFTAALYLAFYVRQVGLVGLAPLAGVGLLWYSVYAKRRPLLGNLVVAGYCAGVAGIVWFAERHAFYQLAKADVSCAALLQHFLWGYMGLAFVATMFREIVKDLEDQPGDAASGLRTLPVAAGVRNTKYLAWSMAALLAAGWAWLLLCCGHMFYVWSLWGLSVLILLPLAYACWLLAKAQVPPDFSQISRWAKWIMLAGLLLPLFVRQVF